MTISRRGFVAVGVGSVGGLLLPRSLPVKAAQNTAASFQMGWIANVENAGEFIAAEKGYYAEEGIDLELVPGGPGVSVEPLVVSGKALVGLSQPDSVARARQQGAALKVVATTFQRNPAAIMSLASSPVPTPQDLVGKKLGIQQSGVPIYDAFFTSIGVDPKSITYVPVQFDPAPLVAGEVDAFVSFQTNQPIQLKLQGIDTTTFLLADFGFNLFTGIDLDRLRRHQAKFIGYALGGPHQYKGRTIRAAHQDLAITETQFAAVAGHLASSLNAFDVPLHLIDQVIQHVAQLKDEVVTR